MSQFDAPVDDFAQGGDDVPPRTSRLSIAALVCSLIFFCPLTTLIGPILGITALATIKSERNERGKGLAIAAILIGLLLTGGWIYGGKRAFDFMYGFYAFMMEAPQETLEHGFAGDFDSLRNQFAGPGAEASDAEVRLFLDTLNDRYGEFVAFRFDEQAGGPPATPGQQQFTMPYRVEFRDETLQADVEFIVEERPGQMPRMRLHSIVIYDEDLGDLRYPADPNDDEGEIDPAESWDHGSGEE